MTNYDVVKKLIGQIRPVGDSAIDPQRLENLKALCDLVLELRADIQAISTDFSHAYESSIKESVKVANFFLTELKEI